MPRSRPRTISGGVPQDNERGVPHAKGYIVRASELGRWAYCRRAWWLRYVAQVEPPPSGQARLDEGQIRHAEHGRGIERAGTLRRFALACLLLAALIGLLCLLVALGQSR
ncbi:MAG: hypothetical protein ACR2M0_14210 [Chloroflexia bacterium]|nr:MAG: hypothetical protein DLM70_19005 [Chloroflexota bacterium]